MFFFFISKEVRLEAGLPVQLSFHLFLPPQLYSNVIGEDKTRKTKFHRLFFLLFILKMNDGKRGCPCGSASLCADPGGRPECSKGFRYLKEHQYKL